MIEEPIFRAPISQEIWSQKYRFQPKGQDGADAVGDATIADTFRRVATAAASAESGRKAKAKWQAEFYNAMADFGFLPAGRILAGAGTNRDVTLFNCFVLGRIPDDLGGIFDAVKEAARTMQAGGGIGHDFSTLRPRGAPVRSIGADASGPVSFMDVWDAMCRTIMSAGARRGAMMGVMRVDHPDIEDFIAAKADPARLRNFNMSVLVTDAFMAAVDSNAAWDLGFDGTLYRTVQARDLWDKIMRATYAQAEPGVIFIDRVNAANNLRYCEDIHATNPCGEQPLPDYGACLLGSINLTQFVRNPFESDACLDRSALKVRVAVAVRLLDNIIDISKFPLDAQAKEAKAKRRIGLGLTGLADALAMLGVSYGSAEATELAESWMRDIQIAAYDASADLAREKGAFELFDAAQHLQSPNVRRLPKDVRKKIKAQGLRNGCLTSIAPTGTISLLAGNVSSGIEPIFDVSYDRKVLNADGTQRTERVEDYAFGLWRRTQQTCTDAAAGGTDPNATGTETATDEDQRRRDVFVRAEDLIPAQHLAMQAALQPWVDSAISKTINCPEDMSFDAFKSIYRDAYRVGLKGCTTYRPNAITGAVLSTADGTRPELGTVSDATIVPEDDAKRASISAPPQASLQTSAQSEPAADSDGVIYLSQPLQREAKLVGATYKLKWPIGGQAIYVTINDTEIGGHRRPFEIFINTRNLSHYAWTVALTRMISAVFRRGGDVSFVGEELKSIFDPQGGAWVDGRYQPSLLAAIGDVIEAHMRSIGFMGEAAAEAPPAEHSKTVHPARSLAASRDPTRPVSRATGSRGTSVPPPSERPFAPGTRTYNPDATNSALHCTRCGAANIIHQEGCRICRTCGFSQCN